MRAKEYRPAADATKLRSIQASERIQTDRVTDPRYNFLRSFAPGTALSFVIG
jgi:hypothetical protein